MITNLGWMWWKVVNREVYAGGGGCKLSFFSLLMYGTPANREESHILEAWPASHYGHFRESADLLRNRGENQLI